MNQTVDIEYTKQLMDKALKGEHMKPELLPNIPSLFAARKLKIATRTVSDAFKQSSEKSMTTYLKQLHNGIDDLQGLLNCRIFSDCAKYYEEESKIAEDMITEFHNYMVTWGNFTNTILGFDRPDDKMHQYLDIGKMSDNDDEYIRTI